jgi:hypothetical protein
MKTKMFFTAVFLLTTCWAVRSQTTADPKPVVLQTMYLNNDMASQDVNVDSLLVVYKKNILDPNSTIKSSKIMRHWWGNDSRQVILMFELDSFSDIQKAFMEQSELTEKYLDNNPEFMKQWQQVMNQSHHADEIYQVVNSSQ